MPQDTISLEPRSIVRTLTFAAVVIVLANLAAQCALHLSGNTDLRPLAHFLYVDEERNLPTAFSVFLLLFAALLLAVIAALQHGRDGKRLSHWSALACGFLLMAIDEAWSFHERAMRPMRKLLGGEELGVLYYAWVVPGFALVLALAAVFARFLWRLPRQTRLRFALAAALYLGGALGVELIAGRFNEMHGLQALQGQTGMVHLKYSFLATVEESLEMAGLLVFIGTLLHLLAHRYGELRVRLVERKSGG